MHFLLHSVVLALELVWRQIVAVAMDSDRVVEGFNILPNQRFSCIEVHNVEPIKPFAFDQRMERFYAGIVVRVALMRITSLHTFCDLAVFLADVLGASVAVNQKRLDSWSSGFGFVNSIYDAGELHRRCKGPGDDFAGV